jgi:hypothetical protein
MCLAARDCRSSPARVVDAAVIRGSVFASLKHAAHGRQKGPQEAIVSDATNESLRLLGHWRLSQGPSWWLAHIGGNFGRDLTPKEVAVKPASGSAVYRWVRRRRSVQLLCVIARHFVLGPGAS